MHYPKNGAGKRRGATFGAVRISTKQIFNEDRK